MNKTRYFIHLAYNGTRFHGWQIQPDQISVQGQIEIALTTILRETVAITGCGRTDTGVHASDYYAHFDTASEITRKTVHGLNALVGDDIVIYDIVKVLPDDHARFTAIERVYHYTLTLRKTPFYRETMSFIPGLNGEHLNVLNAVAQIIPTYTSFKSLSKTGADVPHYRCDVKHCEWSLATPHKLVMEIRANRFLRGMVRLIVGNTARVALGKISLEDLKESIKTEQPIPHALSAPPQGLFLHKIIYPEILQSKLDSRV